MTSYEDSRLEVERLPGVRKEVERARAGVPLVQEEGLAKTVHLDTTGQLD